MSWFKIFVNFYLKFLKLFLIIILTITLGVSFKNLYLSYRYQSFDVPISTAKVNQIMGEPDAIDEHPANNEELWVYEKTLLPSYYVLTVKNNIVIAKYQYIFP